MRFPNYFGFNWNALLDCLRDFDWIEEKYIILIHDCPLNLEYNVYKFTLMFCLTLLKVGKMTILIN
ncbi:MAG: barstar family protein [Dysgonomonas sp.]